MDLRFATTARARLCSRRRRCRCWEDRASAIRDWPGRPQTSQAGGRPMRRRRQLSRRRPRSARRPGCHGETSGVEKPAASRPGETIHGATAAGTPIASRSTAAATAVSQAREGRGASAGAACCADADDRSSSAKATSRADWNRCCGCFSSARCTMRVTVGGIGRPAAESSGGSSCKTADIVSALESF